MTPGKNQVENRCSTHSFKWVVCKIVNKNQIVYNKTYTIYLFHIPTCKCFKFLIALCIKHTTERKFLHLCFYSTRFYFASFFIARVSKASMSDSDGEINEPPRKKPAKKLEKRLIIILEGASLETVLVNMT